MNAPYAIFVRLAAVLIGTACAIAPVTAGALGPPFTTLEKEIGALAAQRLDLRGEVASKTAALTGLAARIDVLKRKQREDPGFLDKYRLESLLADSLDRSRELDALALQVASVEARIATVRAQVVREADARLAEVLASLKTPASPARQRGLVREYLELRRLKDRHRGGPPAGEFPVVEFRAEDLDTPEEIAEKAALLRDFRAKIEDYAAGLDRQAKDLAGEIRLAREMHQLIEEERLFGEGDRFPTTAPVRVEDPRAKTEAGANVPGEREPGVAPPPSPGNTKDDLLRDTARNATLADRLAAVNRERESLRDVLRALGRQEGDLLDRARALLRKAHP
jgi:hypothetical protein